jgi:RNA polymerase sigma factor (sigma-70 family)
MTKQNYCGDDLVIDFQNGNRHAFNKIYEQLLDFMKKCISKELYGYMSNMNQEGILKETEDIIQNAWTELFLTLGNKKRFVPQKTCSTRTWVYGQIMIQCKRWKYQMKRKGRVLAVHDEDLHDAIEKLQKKKDLNNEDLILLRSGMNNWMDACLNDQEIIILKLYFWEEYTFEEIAARLNLKSRKRVHEKYLKARNKLEKYLIKKNIV